MQKKLLSLMILAHSSMMCSYNSHPKIQNLYQTISPDDLLKPMGELRNLVKDVDPEFLSEEMAELAKKTALILRLQREHGIKEYDAQNRKDLEAALVKEFSGEKDAVKVAFDANATKNKEEEKNSNLEEFDGSLGFTGSNPTEKSKVGRAYKEIGSVKSKKDAINQSNYDLVIKNQNTVLKTLKSELEEKKFFMLKYAQAFQQYNKGTKFFAENGLNLDAAKEEDYFDILYLSAYRNTVQRAQEMGITVSVEDMKNVADKNPQTSALARELIATQTHAKEERNKVLNPQMLAVRINLTDDQNDQGALSQ
jgi:hypothetical protein